MSLRICRHPGWLQLTFDRPQARNALDNETLRALARALAEGAAEPELRCIVIDGAGGAAFCAGIDLVERRTLSQEEMGRQSRLALEVVRAAALSPVPLLAAIDGWCLGAGLELALGCDLRIATDAARFGFPEMAMGTYPGAGGAVLLPRVVGHARATALLMSTRRLDAAEALAIGLVNRVVPCEQLSGAVADAVAELCRLSPHAVAAVKESLRRSIALPLEEAFDMDQLLRRPLDGSALHRAALQAALPR